MALTLSGLAALMRGKGTPEQKTAFAEATMKRQISRMPPAQRAAQKKANQTGQPVAYMGGSNKVGVHSGVAQPMNMPTFAATSPVEAPKPAPTAPAPAYDPTPLTIGESSTQNYTMPEIKFPEMPAQQFVPGGASAGVEGNAMGFRRKKSSGKLAGLTSKGTSQFKITGQSGKSSGLNIGV
jgi:hypothetical protein